MVSAEEPAGEAAGEFSAHLVAAPVGRPLLAMTLQPLLPGGVVGAGGAGGEVDHLQTTLAGQMFGPAALPPP